MLLPFLLVAQVASPTNRAVTAALSRSYGPEVLPGDGLAQHDFLYAGEARDERLFIVRHGQIDWSYTHSGRGEISDAIREPNGNILFAHQFGITEISPSREVLWNFDAPPKTEIHTAGPFGTNSVWFVQNGNPAKFRVVNKSTGAMEHEFELLVGNTNITHGQFRHAELTSSGNVLIAHLDLSKVAEYDLNGKEVWSLPIPVPWSATRLANGNLLVVSNRRFVRELNTRNETVWEWTPADTPEYRIDNLQRAVRLANGNTVINNWASPPRGETDPIRYPVQAIEVTPGKKVVWALRSWTAPANLGPSTTIQILDQK